jgi:hypothetical protein
LSKFGLPEPDEAPDASSEQSMSDRLAAFPSKRERHVIDIAAVDAAAATHGFVSRESTTSTGTAAQRNRQGIWQFDCCLVSTIDLSLMQIGINSHTTTR